MSNSITNSINSRDWLIIQPMLRIWFQAAPQLPEVQAVLEPPEELLIIQVTHLSLELQQQYELLNLNQEQQLILDQQIEQSTTINNRQQLINQLQLHLLESIEQQMLMIQMLCDQYEPMKERMNWIWIELNEFVEIANPRIDQQTYQMLINVYENLDQMIPIILEQNIYIENRQNIQHLLFHLRETTEQKKLMIRMLISHYKLMEDLHNLHIRL